MVIRPSLKDGLCMSLGQKKLSFFLFNKFEIKDVSVIQSGLSTSPWSWSRDTGWTWRWPGEDHPPEGCFVVEENTISFFKNL